MDEAILKAVDRALKEGPKGVLCTVVEETGSTPRSMGAKMCVFPDGNIVGTIGGGILEHHVIAEALKLLEENAALVCTESRSRQRKLRGERGGIPRGDRASERDRHLRRRTRGEGFGPRGNDHRLQGNRMGRALGVRQSGQHPLEAYCLFAIERDTG